MGHEHCGYGGREITYDGINSPRGGGNNYQTNEHDGVSERIYMMDRQKRIDKIKQQMLLPQVSRRDVINLLNEAGNSYKLNLNFRNLTECNLQEIDLRGASLVGAILCDANLRGTNFQEANLQSTMFDGANLEEANLQDADMDIIPCVSDNRDYGSKEVMEVKKNILKDKYIKYWNLIREGRSSINYANLKKANLSKARAYGLLLIESKLCGANLTDVAFPHCNLMKSNLQGANLQKANMINAGFNFTNLNGANLTDAYLRNARFYNTSLQNTNLQGADLQTAYIVDTSFAGANLNNANLEDAYLERILFPNTSLQNIVGNINKIRRNAKDFKDLIYVDYMLDSHRHRAKEWSRKRLGLIKTVDDKNHLEFEVRRLQTINSGQE